MPMYAVLQVRAICWSSNDNSIVSAGADGAVYEWRLSDQKREKENVLKGCQYRWVPAVQCGRHQAPCLRATLNLGVQHEVGCEQYAAVMSEWAYIIATKSKRGLRWIWWCLHL